MLSKILGKPYEFMVPSCERQTLSELTGWEREDDVERDSRGWYQRVIRDTPLACTGSST